MKYSQFVKKNYLQILAYLGEKLSGSEKNDFPFSIQICMPIYFAYNLHNIHYHNHFASYCKIQDQLLAFHS